VSAPLTSAQAIERLHRNPAAYQSREALGDLARQVDADSPGEVARLGGSSAYPAVTRHFPEDLWRWLRLPFAAASIVLCRSQALSRSS